MMYLPTPLINVINGGKHANNLLSFQEFMIVPSGASTFAEAMRMSSEVFNTLKKKINEMGYSTAVGDEGGFAPSLENNESALQLLVESIKGANYQLKKDF
jgi:enolase